MMALITDAYMRHSASMGNWFSPLEMMKFWNIILMIHNFSIFYDISRSNCHNMVNTDSSNGLMALHNKPFHEQILTTVY